MSSDRVIRAVQQRISEQGDMGIRVSPQTMRVLLRAVGLRRWEVGDNFREIDALALSALCHLASESLAACTRAERAGLIGTKFYASDPADAFRRCEQEGKGEG